MWRELMGFGWRNVPEVIVLAALIFGLLTLLRGTRGEGMLKTLAAFFAITYIFIRGLATWEGWQGDLRRLTMVLDAIFQASVIALVVIFQPELRRGLALKIGTRFFADTRPERPVVEEIIEAATVLSKNRVGALVALERKDSLKEYMGSGTVIDAQVTSALLQSIFFVGTPLHDGAVIIQDGRLAAAGCFLPPTDPNNPTVPKSLGARHRAAIGLSEVEDSLVVIVSEETGGISLAENGTLHRDLDRDGLLSLLEALYLSQEHHGEPEELPSLEPLGEPEAVDPGPKSGTIKGKTTTRVKRRTAV